AIRLDEAKREVEEAVADRVARALRSRARGRRSALLHELEALEHGEMLMRLRRVETRERRDLTVARGALRNRLEHREILARVAQLLAQQQVRLLVQEAVMAKHVVEDVVLQCARVREAREVVRHAAADGERPNAVLGRVTGREQRGRAVVERRELELAVAPSVHGAGEDVVAEERDFAAGDHEYEREPPAGSPPPRVQQRRQLTLAPREELELVEHHERALPRRREACDRGERSAPTCERLLCEQVVAARERQLLREAAQLHRLGRIGRLEVEGTPSLGEARQQLGLADAAAPPQDEEARIGRPPEVLERRQLVGAVEELHAADPTITL